MAFSFNFSGDDIDADIAGFPLSLTPAQAPARPRHSTPNTTPCRHTLRLLAACLPSKISYNTLEIPIDNGPPLLIPRRELFDVRIQIMAEDDGSGNECLLGSANSDVQAGIYEGGLKSWECSVDLVKVLSAHEYRYMAGVRKDIIEVKCRSQTAKAWEWLIVPQLGCGTALPSLLLFQRALSRGQGPSCSNDSPIRFVLADYNVDVLNLVTVPNIFLSWAMLRANSSRGGSWLHEGDLDIEPDTLAQFLENLEELEITIDLLSGAWSEEFSGLVSTVLAENHRNTLDGELEQLGPHISSKVLGPTLPTRHRLILASETIYSPESLPSFTKVVMNALSDQSRTLDSQPSAPEASKTRPSSVSSRALLAAKTMYFGVGGSVAEAMQEFLQLGAIISNVEVPGGLGSQGVSRAVFQVSLG
ncbi:MAG: hypothetical protein M1829_002403 [Trizodia sp. TS-e1964]|nr:MAG: hypothetical protein M1829_002403 [Trizodia sp. TS-e1964]